AGGGVDEGLPGRHRDDLVLEAHVGVVLTDARDALRQEPLALVGVDAAGLAAPHVGRGRRDAPGVEGDDGLARVLGPAAGVLERGRAGAGAVDADHDAPRVGVVRRTYDDDRARRVACEVLADRTDERLARAAVAVTAGHEQRRGLGRAQERV